MSQEKASKSSASSLFLLLFGLSAEQENQQEENKKYMLHITGVRNMNPLDPEKVGQQLALEAVQHVWKSEEFEKMGMSRKELRAFRAELKHLLKQKKSCKGSKRQKQQD